MGRENIYRLGIILFMMISSGCLKDHMDEEEGDRFTRSVVNISPGEISDENGDPYLNGTQVELLTYDDGKYLELYGDCIIKNQSVRISGFRIDEHLMICKVHNATVILNYKTSHYGNTSTHLLWTLNSTFETGGVIPGSDLSSGTMEIPLFKDLDLECGDMCSLVICIYSQGAALGARRLYIDSIRLRLDCTRRI
jgi:hypothetical protein